MSHREQAITERQSIAFPAQDQVITWLEVDPTSKQEKMPLNIIQLTDKEARRSDDLAPTIEHKLPVPTLPRVPAARLKPDHCHQLAVAVLVLYAQHSHHRVEGKRRFRDDNRPLL